jgi:hypothetical protein
MGMVAYRHDIDDIIIKSLASSPGGWVDDDESLWIVFGTFGTFNRLFEVIKRTYPGISKTTFQGHLDKMVEHGVLRNFTAGLSRPPDVGTAKRTLYLLTKDTYINIRDNNRYPTIRSNREPRTK